MFGVYYMKEYGKVFFNDIFIHNNGYDGIKIRPIFSNPEKCQSEIFEYTIADSSICYISADRVYFLSYGETLVIAKSEHFEESFKVFSKEFDFESRADEQLERLENEYEGEETLFLGDSFFEFWRTGNNITTTFDEVFAKYKVFNIGLGGSTTHDWRAINSKLFSKVSSPKNIIINIGINNVDDDNESGEQCAFNVRCLIEDYLEKYPNTNVYYLSLTRCTGYFAHKWEHHSLSNQLMELYCNKTARLHYLDVMKYYGDDYPEFVYDGLHPNQGGYDLFEKVIKENVEFEEK